MELQESPVTAEPVNEDVESVNEKSEFGAENGSAAAAAAAEATETTEVGNAEAGNETTGNTTEQETNTSTGSSPEAKVECVPRNLTADEVKRQLFSALRSQPSTAVPTKPKGSARC